MGTWPVILAQDGSGSELIYIIAVLILGAVGAIFEKIKHKMAEPEDDKRKRPPVVPPGPARPARPPVRPSRPPVAAPPARPTREAPPVARPAAPARHPAPRRPPARRPAPAVSRPVAPAPRPPREAQRPVPAELLPSVSRPAPGEREVTHLPKRHVPTRVEEGETDRRPLGVLTPAAGTRPAAGAGPVPADLVSDVGSFRNLTLAEVRRAIVLNEILSAPLALRNTNSLDRW